MNSKFLIGLSNCKSSRSVLPISWISNCFEKISNIKDIDTNYYRRFFKDKVNILQCYFKLPSRRKWEGHPFYYEGLLAIQNISIKLPDSIHDLLSTPLWHNKFLNTKFDCELSRTGFNFIKDIIIEGNIMNPTYLRKFDISIWKKNLILKICNKLPPNLKQILSDNHQLSSVPYPRLAFDNDNSLFFLDSCKSKDIYNVLISKKVKLPVGMHRWCFKYDISEERLTNAFTFSHRSTLSTQSRAIQYKISTFTLPTGE